jgi:hypothetical protein
MGRYDYKKPRSINWVTIFLLLLLGAGGYAGWKFIPVWWQAQKVDEALDEIKLEVASIQGWTPEQRRVAEERLRAKSLARIKELGIEDQPNRPVHVGFTPDYSHILVNYEVVVEHPFGKTTRIKMERKVKVPATRGGL